MIDNRFNSSEFIDRSKQKLMIAMIEREKKIIEMENLANDFAIKFAISLDEAKRAIVELGEQRVVEIFILGEPEGVDDIGRLFAEKLGTKKKKPRIDKRSPKAPPWSRNRWNKGGRK
jgi:hypothetical protein